MTLPCRLRRLVLATAGPLLGLVLGALFLAQPAQADPSREEIFDALNVDQVPADYVILVDTSWSMSANGLYGSVRKTLLAFLTGLSSTDYVAVYTFDSIPTPRYLGPADDPDRIVDSLPPGPTPNGRTDIGSAIERALDEVQRSGAASVAAVVLITDGIHDPPATSRYGEPGDSDWQALTNRAAGLSGRSVSGYALSLGGKNGAGVLKTVITSTTVLDPTTIGELAQYLDRAKTGTRIDKARSALGGDIGQGVTASWAVPDGVDLASGQTAITLTLTAQTAHASLVVTGLQLASGEASTVVGTLPATLTLGPGEQRSFPLTLHLQPAAGVIPFHDEKQVRIPVSVSGQVVSPWSAPLRPDIKLDIRPEIDNATYSVSDKVVVGTWRAQLIVGATALLLGALGYGLWYRWRHVPMRGTLVAISAATGDELARFPLNGRRARLRGIQLPGMGWLSARRVPRRYTHPDGVEYTVVYQRGDHRRRGTFPTGGSTLVGGVAFEHHAVPALGTGGVGSAHWPEPIRVSPPLTPPATPWLPGS